MPQLGYSTSGESPPLLAISCSIVDDSTFAWRAAAVVLAVVSVLVLRQPAVRTRRDEKLTTQDH